MTEGTPSSGRSLARFEVTLIASDLPTNRRRWNGDPMPSDAANRALLEAVEAFQAAVRREGLAVVRTGYGVSAHRPATGQRETP